MKNNEKLKSSAKKFLDGKENINLRALKEDNELKFKRTLKVIEDFEKDLTSFLSSTLPDGFVLKVRISNSESLMCDDEAEVNFFIEDKNRKAGQSKAKYFWITDSSVNLSFNSNELINYNTRSIHGGFNGNEYGDSSKPKIDAITISEIMMDINASYLKLMKDAKNNPEMYIKNISLYSKAREDYSEARKKVKGEEKRLNKIKFDSELDSITSVFTPLNQKQLSVLENQLINSDKYQKIISIVSMPIPDDFTASCVNFNTVEIKCTSNENRKTFAVKTCQDDTFKRIKASEVLEILSSGVTVNGNYVESIKDLLSQVDKLVLNNFVEDYNKKYISCEKSLRVPTDMMIVKKPKI